MQSMVCLFSMACILAQMQCWYVFSSIKSGPTSGNRSNAYRFICILLHESYDLRESHHC